ncbi:MAG: hypothetical protein H2043_03120 [Rhizobiales bacterium]|nr:hypothetical protein [Hyphomicrobiales bacterium]
MLIITGMKSNREKMLDTADQARARFTDLKRSVRKIELALENLEGGSTSQPLSNAAELVVVRAIELAKCARLLSDLADGVAKAERSRIAKLAAQRSRERRWLEWSSYVHEESARNDGDVYLGEFELGVAKVFWKGRLAGHVADHTSRFHSNEPKGYMALDPLMKVWRKGYHRCVESAIQQVIDEIEHRMPPQKTGKR